MVALAGTLGSPQRVSAGGSTITVPSDATGVVHFVGIRGSQTITSITLADNSNLSQLSWDPADGYAPAAAVYFQDITSTGSKAAQINFSAFPANGYQSVMVFVKDLAAAPAHRDVESISVPGSGAFSMTADSTAADLVLSFHSKTTTAVADVTGWTTLITETTTDLKGKMFVADSPGATTTTFDPADSAEICCSIVSFKGAGSGATLSGSAVTSNAGVNTLSIAVPL